MAGTIYLPDFITERHEASILKQLDEGLWKLTNKQRSQDFGFLFSANKQRITEKSYLGELPKWTQPITFLIKNKCNIGQEFNQATADKVLPGDGTLPYTESPICFDNVVAILSLGSSLNLFFANNGDKTQPRNAVFKRFLERRSLLVLSGVGRFYYTRYIEARKVEKHNGESVLRERYVGVTLRTVLDPFLQIDDELIVELRAELDGRIEVNV